MSKHDNKKPEAEAPPAPAAPAAKAPEPAPAIVLPPPAAPPAPAEEMEPGLRIVSCSPRGSFRRAGFAFNNKEAKELALSQLKPEQIKALKEERMLVVVECPVKKA